MIAAMNADATISEDALLGGRVRLLQPAAGYRVAVDPVLLAAAVRAPGGGRGLDLGCGTGAAALCLAARRPDLAVYGVERQAEYAALARRSAELSGLSARVKVSDGDIRDLGKTPGEGGNFDAVLANPPYFTGGTRSPDAGRAAAHHLDKDVALGDWIAAAARCLKPKGEFVLISPAERLGEVLAGLSPRFGAVQAIPLWPKAAHPAKRVLVRARLGRKTPFALLPGLILHAADGTYTAAAERLLRDAAALDEAMESPP
jgi:tRNA1(Val) A37 N6-methylase TrmN6